MCFQFWKTTQFQKYPWKKYLVRILFLLMFFSHVLLSHEAISTFKNCVFITCQFTKYTPVHFVCRAKFQLSRASFTDTNTNYRRKNRTASILYRVPKKHRNSVTNSISPLLWISILIPNFKSHNIILSARV